MQKSQKPQDFYKMKSWCDAKDETGVWRVGRIKKRVSTKILVIFDGWSEKYKRTYCTHSGFIAPFRMHTIGYTGQKTVALRDWDYADNLLKFPSGLMLILIHSNFTGVSPYELTNFLRGDLYVLVDCLLCHTYSNPMKDVNDVVEFFKNVISLIIKWMSLVPTEVKNCDFDQPDNYLYNNSDAICKSIYELTDMLCNIFGFNPRTALFYEKYKTITTNRKVIQHFISERGMEALIGLIKLRSIGFEQIWHLVIHIPTVFTKATIAANDKFIKSLTDCLINEFEVLPSESLSEITENSENVSTFMKNFESMIELVSSPYEKENYIEAFRKFFKLRKQAEPESATTEMFRISLTSPRNKPPTGLRSQKSNLVSPPKQSDQQRQELSSYNTSMIKDLIDKKFEECVKMIESKFTIRENTEENLKIVLQEHSGCDQQEFSILCTIELLLSEGKTEEALRLIRWRKKILKVANSNGWNVASYLAKHTLFKLDISSNDLIEANLKIMAEDEEGSEGFN